MQNDRPQHSLLRQDGYRRIEVITGQRRPCIDSRGREMAGVAITRTDMSAAELRAAARLSANARQASRILAIAMVLDGFSREAAARLCGMDRQSLRDWVHRYNQEGLDGLADRARSGRPASLSWVEQGKFSSWVEEGADLARDGVVRFRRVDLRDRIAAEFGVSLHERSVGKLLRRLGFRRLSVRPQHPKSDPAAQEAFKKTLRPSPRKRSASALASRSKSGSRTKQGSDSKGR